MSNSITSTGLSVGVFGNSIKEILDASTGKVGVVTISNGTLSIDTVSSSGSSSASNNSTVTLPSISVGQLRQQALRASSFFVLNAKVKLPSSGSYIWGTSLPLNLATSSKASGGSQIWSGSLSEDSNQIFYYFRYA